MLNICKPQQLITYYQSLVSWQTPYLTQASQEYKPCAIHEHALGLILCDKISTIMYNNVQLQRKQEYIKLSELSTSAYACTSILHGVAGPDPAMGVLWYVCRQKGTSDSEVLMICIWSAKVVIIKPFCHQRITFIFPVLDWLTVLSVILPLLF